MKKKLIQRMTFVKTPIFSKKYYETKKNKSDRIWNQINWIRSIKLLILSIGRGSNAQLYITTGDSLSLIYLYLKPKINSQIKVIITAIISLI